MKKLVYIFLLCNFSFLIAQSISLDKDVIDYGDVRLNSDGHKSFTITNKGNKPLIISNVKSSCDCSIVSWTKTPILSGKTGQVNISYNTKIKGKFLKSIEIYSNGLDSPRKVVKIKGNVL